MFIKGLKKFMSCTTCGPTSNENKDRYKCQACGSIVNDEAGECCGSSREKLCSCGSGKIAKECCKAGA